MWGFALLPLDKDFDAPLCKTLRLWKHCGSKQKPSEIGLITGVEFEKQDSNIISIFLELSCFDDLIGFKSSVEEECHDIDEASLWYGRRIGSKMMDLKRRQPS